MRLWPRRKVYVDDLPKTHDLRFATVFLLGFVVLVASLYGVGYFLAGDRLPAGTRVAGVDVGGMRAGEARTVLQSELVPRIGRPVQATVAGFEFELDPQESGLTLDIDATIDEALGGGPWDPRHMLQVVTGGGDVTPVVVVDAAEMRAALEPIQRRVKRPPVDAKVTFPGGLPQVRYAEVGRALSFGPAASRLREALLSQDRAVSLPVEAVEPTISSTAATRFAADQAGQALSGPLRLRVGNATTVNVPVSVFAPALRAVVDKGELELAVDPDTLMSRSKRILSELPSRAVSAKVVFRNNRPTIRPSRDGVTVSPQAWVAGVQRAYVKTGDRRTATVKTTIDEPRFSTRQVRRLGIRSLVATKAVTYSDGGTGGDPTIVARQLDGVTLLPGDTLQFGRRVDWRAQPSAASLLASATYDAAFRSGMTVVERTSSPFYSPQFTAGLDAVVSQRGEALVLRNDGPYGVYVRAYVDSLRDRTGTLHVELWSTPYVTVTVSSSDRYNVITPQPLVDYSTGCTPRAGSPGFDIDVTRTVQRGPRPGPRTDRTHSLYSPLAAIVCR